MDDPVGGDQASEADDELVEWDPDTDSLAEMDHLITAVAREWNGGRAVLGSQDSGEPLHKPWGPCRCCGVVLSDLDYIDDPPLALPNRPEAVEKAQSFLKAALWNAQLVRQAIPARNELFTARAAMVRIHKLLTGDYEDIAHANGRNRDFPEDVTEEQRDERLLGGWYPPEYFFEKYKEMEAPQEATTAAAEEFVASADTLIEEIDRFILSRMFDPPPNSGRPRTAFAERYVCRYLTEMGLSPTEVEESIRPLVLKLRAAEQTMGLKRFPKSANPRSLRSTIRRLASRK